MYPTADPARWDRAIGASHRPVIRVELWSEGALVADNVTFTGGSVTDDYKTGIRRSLDLTVPATTQWLTWLALPGLEIRPYRGLQWSPSNAEMLPLGRFPILPPDMKLPLADIKITADDYYERVVLDDFLGPTQSYGGTIVYVAARLITESTGIPITNTVTDRTAATSLVWDNKTKVSVISDYLDSVSAVAYIDRLGNAIVAPAGTGPALGPLTGGQGGTIITVSTATDFSGVRNAVGARSSAKDVDFGVAVAVISDPTHPAHRYRIGQRTEAYASPLLLTYDQGLRAAYTLLAKKSAPARTLTIACVPDPRRDAGDAVTVVTAYATESAVIQKITHPLTAGDKQTITTGATL